MVIEQTVPHVNRAAMPAAWEKTIPATRFGVILRQLVTKIIGYELAAVVDFRREQLAGGARA